MNTEYEQYDDPSPDRWIERQLRRIPLPAGLLRRLRKIVESEDSVSVGKGASDAKGLSDGAWSDAALDAALCNVPLPEGLQSRLHRGALAESSPFREERRGLRRLDDEKLDAALCDVAIPTGLTNRLAEITTSDASTRHESSTVPSAESQNGDALTNPLSDVPVPSGLLERLSQIPMEAASSSEADRSQETSQTTERPQAKHRDSLANRRRAKRTSMTWQWASGMALSVGLLVSLVYFGSDYLRPTTTADTSNPASDNANALATSGSNNGGGNVSSNLSDGLDPPDGSGLDDGGDALVSDALLVDGFTSDIDEWFPVIPPGNVDPENPLRRDAGNNISSRLLTNDPGQRRPTLDVVNALQWRGVRPPWVDAEALTAQMHSGFHPFVSPAKHEQLRTRRLPLYGGRDSYDWLATALPRQPIERTQLARWRKLLANRIRTEDFINAVDYQYPAPRRQALALRAYGGTSPFGKQGTQLLHIGVQAASIAPAQRAPTHFVVLVDTSPSMARNNRLPQVRQALSRLLDSMGSSDRVTIVSTSYQPAGPVAKIENASVEQRSQIREMISSLQAAPHQDLPSAIRLSSQLVQETANEPNGRRVLAWLTDGNDGTGEASTSWQKETQQSLHDLMAAGSPDNEAKAVDLQIVDVAGDRENKDGSDELAKLIASNDDDSATLAVASDTETIYWTLRESLAGTSLAVAHDTEVEISFDPDTVAAYRLLGHEATTIVGPENKSLRITMHGSQAATVLFEVKLHSTGSDSVATAKLTWRDAKTGQTEEKIQHISRWQFVPSFEESALPLQAATIAAATAESLRQSIHTSPANLSISNVRGLAWSVHQKVAKNHSFERLIRLLRQAEEVGL